MRLRGKQKLVFGIALVVFANVLMGVLLFQGGLYREQTYLNDQVLRNSAQHPDDRIVVVAIDNTSLKAYGRLGAWDRAHYAQLIARLKDDGARVAAFDVYFDPPTPRDPIVAQAIAYAQSTANGTPPMPVVLATVGDGDKGRLAGQGLGYDQFLPPSQLMLAGRPQLANVTVDPDGAVVRHLPLRAFAGAQHYFLLPFVAVNDYLRLPALEQSAKLQSNGIAAAGRLIPTDQYYRMLINYEGKPFAFKHYSLSDVADGKVDPALLKDKLVFVGELGATSLVDNYPVPTSTKVKMDGVEIWANGAQNILDGKFVMPEGVVSSLIFMVALSVAGAAGFFLWGAVGWLLSLGVMALYSLAAYFWTITRLNGPNDVAQIVPVPNLAYVNGDVLLTGLLLFIYFFIYEQRSRRAINQMFGKYVTPEVAKHLMDMQEQGQLGLGGSRKTATIMFGDIRGFTTLSEGMEPEEVMGMLNRYFDHMVEIIVKHGGTISKFIGDNVMVLFNLPVQMKENHALAAARAGFEIQEWIKVYREAHPEELAAFGFGISSGELVAGNMGSEERMEYTVIGDPVREADELCATAAANEVAISESTYALIKDSGVTVSDMGLVTIKGKSEQIHMFTVEGVASHA